MDPYDSIAPFYDREHQDFTDDIDFYLELVDQGPVLEVGAGTGRIMQALTRRGLEVWGVESSAAMLALATNRLRGESLAHLVPGSVESLPAEATYRWVLVPLNTLWHFRSTRAQLSALLAIRGQLAPLGRVVIDLTNPLTMADRHARGELRQRFRRQDDGDYLTGYSSTWDDEAEQLLWMDLTYEESESDGMFRQYCAEIELRYVYRNELELLLALSHLEPVAIHGDYGLEPYTATSPNLIAVAQRSS